MALDAEIDFHGAKVAFFVEDRLLVYRRDDNPDIPFPDMLDLPGGGRENQESGAECVVRETFEEFGIRVEACDIEFIREYSNWRGSGAQALFFVGRLSQSQIGQIIFGDEGQGWQTMAVQDFLASDEAVPHLKTRLQEYLEKEAKTPAAYP